VSAGAHELPDQLDRKTIEVEAGDLPVHCPLSSMKLWNTHPRVYLALEQTGEARCPYCGTHYVLKGGPRAGSH